MKQEGISFLKEEMVQLSIKSLKVEVQEKPSFICSVWIKKLFNPDNFHAQIKIL